MENGNLIIAAIAIPSLLTYKWVQDNFVAQPRHNHPTIFRTPGNPMSALLIVSPILGIITAMGLAFFITEHAIAWTIGIIVFGIGFSQQKHKDHDPF